MMQNAEPGLFTNQSLVVACCYSKSVNGDLSKRPHRMSRNALASGSPGEVDNRELALNG